VLSTCDRLLSLSIIWPFTFTYKMLGAMILQVEQRNMPSSYCMISLRWHIEQVHTNGVMAKMGTFNFPITCNNNTWKLCHILQSSS
jgi:hypothetical protein